MSWFIFIITTLSLLQNKIEVHAIVKLKIFVNELIVVHVSAHLTMVKSLYLGHVYALDEKVEAVNKDPVGKEKELSTMIFPFQLKIRCSF